MILYLIAILITLTPLSDRGQITQGDWVAEVVTKDNKFVVLASTSKIKQSDLVQYFGGGSNILQSDIYKAEGAVLVSDLSQLKGSLLRIETTDGNNYNFDVPEYIQINTITDAQNVLSSTFSGKTVLNYAL